MTDTTKPMTQSEAEELAKKMVGEYLTACRMTDQSQIGNYLMKLCSVAGVLMAHAEGSTEAYARLSGTARFVRDNMPKMPATLRKMQ